MKSLKNKVAIGLIAGTLACGGCSIKYTSSRQYDGAPIPRREVVDKKEEISYYFSEMERNSNDLELKVSKSQNTIDTVKTFNEIPVYEEKYEVIESPKGGTGFAQVGLEYLFSCVYSAGILPTIDLILCLSGKDEKTYYSYVLQKNYVKRKTENGKTLSKEQVRSKQENIETEENVSKSVNLLPEKVEVKIVFEGKDSLVKQTNDNGYTKFDIPENYSGPIIIETLGRDGKNEVKSIQ